MTYHTASFGATLYDRIGVIKFMVDGDIIHELDLGELLSLVRFRDSFGNRLPDGEREPYFRNWKKEAYKKRAKAGLPVVNVAEDVKEDKVE